jgi:L-erythro-3,5-diaminohexanoate dehydrogenase
VLGLVHHAEGLEPLRKLGFEDVIVADALDPVGTVRAAAEAFGGDETGVADLVVNCVNVPGTEGTSIMLTEEGGTLYFFSMATSFTAAALTAEGLGKDVTMMIGSGYAPGHADLAVRLLRDNPEVRAVLEERFGG